MMVLLRQKPNLWLKGEKVGHTLQWYCFVPKGVHLSKEEGKKIVFSAGVLIKINRHGMKETNRILPEEKGVLQIKRTDILDSFVEPIN